MLGIGAVRRELSLRSRTLFLFFTHCLCLIVAVCSDCWLQTGETSGTITRVSLNDAMKAYESDLIQDALKTTRGNRAKAARLLDTTERIINYKVKQLGIDYTRFKS